LAIGAHVGAAQEPSAAKPQTAAKTPELAAQIELLETRVRFEANGDSRKEVHAQVHINNELGVPQFARLRFDYNRAFQQVEIPVVRISHASGGTAEILPSAITDQPNPAVVNAPAYQDVRVKSVRILGLAPGDNLEYRVITTTTHHPLAPDFWLDHTFDRSGVVSHEIFELDLPASRQPQIKINPATPVSAEKTSGENESARTFLRWEVTSTESLTKPQSTGKDTEPEPDVSLSTESWEMLSVRLDENLTPGAKSVEKARSYEEAMRELSRQPAPSTVAAKAANLARTGESQRRKLEALYDFVSQKISTIDLPLGSTGFVARPASETLSSGYGTPEDKYVLFAALASAVRVSARAGLVGYCDAKTPARTTVFKRLVIIAGEGEYGFWLDPSLEVAPFGVIPPNPGGCVFMLSRAFFGMNSTGHEWQWANPRPPFPSIQRVTVGARLSSDGTLDANVKYVLRGDNELLLRVAFHQAPRDKWNDVAQLLALSDGFRGKVTRASASDPYDTKNPFTVEYEITQPKFVDWSKTPVRIPALLPLVGLPNLASKAAEGTAASAVELGTPLDVDTRVTLHLPADTSAEVPTGTAVTRDYAKFVSEYSVNGPMVTAARHLSFLLREVPGSRATDYDAFVRVVQTDEAQEFTLSRPAPPQVKPAAAP
jgi:Domain of Unknown Function with PDB structure (DUF3857)